MQSNKTIKALSALSPQELNWFRQYVRSPYFNVHEKLIKLLDIICDASPAFDEGKLNAKLVFQKIFPGKNFHPQKISDLLTYLFRLYEKFLIQEVFENDEAQQKLALIKTYRERNLDRSFIKAVTVLRSNGHFKGTGELQLYNRYRLESESDFFFSSKDSRTTDKSIERKTFCLDLFYLTAKLRSCCEMINRQNIVSETYEIRMLEEVKSHVERHVNLLEHYPVILIYYHILLTLQESEIENHYKNLVELLLNHSAEVERSELRSMYDYAQNYCIKKINSGNSRYLNEIFKLYKTLLEKDIVLDERQQLSQWDYKNIVTVGTRLKEYRWCEKFLNDYRPKLPDAERENAFAFNLATLYYSQKNYDKALHLLQSVEFTDVYYSLGGRSLLLKVYYEANEFEPLYSLFDSFKIYLKRNKLVSTYQYTVHMNLIRMTRRLANIKAMAGLSRKETIRKHLDKLKQRIARTPEITNLNWLNEQIEILSD